LLASPASLAREPVKQPSSRAVDFGRPVRTHNGATPAVVSASVALDEISFRLVSASTDARILAEAETPAHT